MTTSVPPLFFALLALSALSCDRGGPSATDVDGIRPVDARSDRRGPGECDETSCVIDHQKRGVCCCFDEKNWPPCCPEMSHPLQGAAASPTGVVYTTCNETYPRGWTPLGPAIRDMAVDVLNRDQ